MEWLTVVLAGYPAWVWLMFGGIVLGLLAFDLGFLHKDQQEISVAESFKLSALYIAIGLAFGGWVWWYQGADAGLQYLTGYLIEKTLSMDNVFVIAMIFGSLAVPRRYQHRVLFWGILGALVMRALMIGAGAALVAEFQWILAVFGVFLVFSGIKMLMPESETRLEDGRLYQWLTRKLRFTRELHGERFWVRGDGGRAAGWWATPLFLALLLVEAADLMFAVDSIPAIFAVSRDPFIVYTSNIFAILGLRALYFALAAMVHRFAYLKYALAAVLVFVGIKIGLVYLHDIQIVNFKIPTALSLAVTVTLLIAGVVYSQYRTRDAVVPAGDDHDARR